MYGKMLTKDMALFDAMNEPLDEQEKALVSEIYHDTDSHVANAIVLAQGAPKGASLYTLYEQSLQGWQKLPDHLLALTVREFEAVMDDGLANGFEFRLQGSTIIYREVQH